MCVCVCIIFICQISLSEPIRTNTSTVVLCITCGNCHVSFVQLEICAIRRLMMFAWLRLTLLLYSSSLSMRMIKRGKKSVKDSLVPSVSVFVPNKYLTFSIDVSNAFIHNELQLFRLLFDQTMWRQRTTTLRIRQRWNWSEFSADRLINRLDWSAEWSESLSHTDSIFETLTRLKISRRWSSFPSFFLFSSSSWDFFDCGFAQFRRHLEIIRQWGEMIQKWCVFDVKRREEEFVYPSVTSIDNDSCPLGNIWCSFFLLLSIINLLK